MNNKDLISSVLGHRGPLLNLNARLTENRVLSQVVTTVTDARPKAELVSSDPLRDSGGDPSQDACDTIDPGDPLDNPGDATDPGSDPSDPLSDPGSDNIGDPGGGGGDNGGGFDYFGW